MLLPVNGSSCGADMSVTNRSADASVGAEADGAPGPEAVIVPVVFGLIFVVGLVGNSLVMVVIGRVKCSGGARALSPTNIFIVNLSVADLLFLLFCVPLHATIYSLPEWVFGAFACKFGHFLFTVSMLVSIFTLVAMSVDRYIAVVRSKKSACVRSRRNALVGLGVIWTLSLVCSVPVAQHQVITNHPSAPNSSFCWDNRTGASRAAYRVSVLVLGYLLPLLLICCCYTRKDEELVQEIKALQKKDRSDCPPPRLRLHHLLDAPSHHRYVGGVRQLPSDQRLLRFPDRCPLPVLRTLLREPGPLRLPVRELPESLPSGFQPPPPAAASLHQQSGPLPHGQLLHHTLHHQHLMGQDIWS
ncbi:galanin receptor type 1b isoform X1 [Melanotaenia boesemani]|uniref:galanin receptor type 1b isoform X1 n=1 Tax=Melanotaenia boesemani TaxID=1250792 RepID=UPI001C051DFD|nr:galanin receptor type 1b isoform X1 [Melanotaenia boesemani]